MRQVRTEQQHPKAPRTARVIEEAHPVDRSGGREQACAIAYLGERPPAMLGAVAGLKETRVVGPQHADAHAEQIDLGGSIPNLLALRSKRKITGRQLPMEIYDTVFA